MRLVAASAALLLVALIACTEPEPNRGVRPRAAPDARMERSTTSPRRDGLRVDLQARGRARDLLRVAVADLRRIDLWEELTRHLYVIELDSRVGRANVPDDGHLADAYYTGLIDERGAGGLCDLMFFPTAIDDDLVRWRGYYERGLIAEAPPTLRHFWASLLAHELAHCARGPRGERHARATEERARGLLRN